MKPVCVPCQRFFKPKRNGVGVLENRPNGNGVPAGIEAADQWLPYKLWDADLYECQGCGAQIVVGFGQMPLAEHFQQERFAAFRESKGPHIVTVNDC